MKYLVTGATGFIGSALCRRLAREHEIVAFCRDTSRCPQHNNVIPIQGELFDRDKLDKAMHGVDACFHLAGLAGQWHANPDAFRQVNVEGTRSIFEAALNASVRRVVMTSTAGVFGSSSNGELINEESLISIERLTTEYERTKLLGQKLAHEYSKRLDCVIVNPTRVFGPGPLNESNSVTKIIQKYSKGKWRFMPGLGSAIGNYVFVDDVVEGHLVALERGSTGQCYILGGENLSFRDLFGMFGKATKNPRKLIPVPITLLMLFAYFESFKAKLTGGKPILTPAFASKYRKDYPLSSEKAVVELGYQVTPVCSAVQKTLEWFQTFES